MSGNHFGEQRRSAPGNNPDNPSSFVPYHHRLSIRPAKIPDQGLSLRVRHVWKSWGAGPKNEVAVPSRKENTRVPFLAGSFFPGDIDPGVTTMHLPWFGRYGRLNIIVIFDLFWTMYSLFLRAARVKFN